MSWCRTSGEGEPAEKWPALLGGVAVTTDGPVPGVIAVAAPVAAAAMTPAVAVARLTSFSIGVPPGVPDSSRTDEKRGDRHGYGRLAGRTHVAPVSCR
ncbi:hypothetical protein GCM10022252_22470 [Streptosporangium oxazolinicum]|uniref:Uncharacterized protein n=1 Tax=Streptosporangium oxazolinicum TaxID=909287 RepID=A0ABP8AQH1_9ACTN